MVGRERGGRRTGAERGRLMVWVLNEAAVIWNLKLRGG